MGLTDENIKGIEDELGYQLSQEVGKKERLKEIAEEYLSYSKNYKFLNETMGLTDDDIIYLRREEDEENFLAVETEETLKKRAEEYLSSKKK